MSQVRQFQVRRTQAERSAETRQALIEAAIQTIHRLGYGAATTAEIADSAGVSRGSIIHQFGTRAELMGEVVRHVFETEVEDYRRLMGELELGGRVSDWIELTWRVLSRPSAIAMLEILLACRSDPELAGKVRPMQAINDKRAQETLGEWFGGDPEALAARIHLIHWAVRGLTIGQRIDGEASTEAAVALFRNWLRAAEDAGVSLRERPPRRA